MYRIALICEHGASTGMCVQRMIAAAKEESIDAEISAHSASQVATLVDTEDVLLIGPQLGFRLDSFKSQFPTQANKFAVVNSMDFGMMDGAKILHSAMVIADQNK